MPRTRSEALAELLRRLLDGYERGRSFGRPAPWPRDVIVKLDERAFPEAFAPDGREELLLLRAAAGELASRGAARVVCAAGWSDGEPREVRLGPAELVRAYDLGREHGYEPLETALERVAAHATRLAEVAPAWLARFFAGLATAAAGGALAPLGMTGERAKREWRDLLSAMTAAVRIAPGVSAWERVVSEEIFGDSKRLGELRARVADLLVRADPRWGGWTPEDAQEVLEAYGVRRKPGLLRCAGRAELSIGDRAYRLEDFVPVAHLPEAWAEPWVDALAAARVRTLTTVENEVPFLSYVEERGGPRGLGDAGEVVVYTAGFPTPALMTALAELCRACPELAVRHFGDADLGGLRIWWYLRQRLDRPVHPFRVDRDWLDAKVARRAGTRLTPGERAQLERLRRELDRGGQALVADVRAALQLLDGLLAHGMKVEQERG